MSALRILAVTHRYPPYTAGGYELRTRDVVEGLRARGHEVHVLCGRGTRLASEPGVHARLAPDLDRAGDWFRHSFDSGNAERFSLHFFRLGNWLATRSVIDRLRPDLVLYFNMSMLSMAPILAARHLGVPTLGDVSDPWPMNHWVLAWREAEEARGESSPRRRALERAWTGFRALVGLGTMLVPSEYLKERFARDGVPVDDMRVLPTALSPTSFPLPAEAEPAERSGDEPLRVLSTAALWEGKGVHVLLDGVLLARARGAAIELTVAGTGDADYLARLEERVASAGEGDAVRFVGALPRERVAEELGRAHLFGFPSAWGEPFSRATLEAMSHAVPVLARHAGANPEQVRHGEDGWLVESAEPEEWAAALETLAADEELRSRLARAARRRFVEEVDFDRYLDRYEEACLAAARGAA